MNQQTKLIVIILALLAVCGLSGTFLLYQDGQKNLQKFKATQRTLTQSIQALQEENATLRQNEQRLTDDQKALEEQRAIALQDLEQVKRELSQAKDDVSVLTAQVDTLKGERDALHDQLDKLTQLQKERDQQLAQLRRTKTNLDTMTADLQRQLARLQEEHEDLLKERMALRPSLSAATDDASSSSIPQLAASVGEEGSRHAAPGAGGGTPGTVTLPPIIVQPAALGSENPAALSSLAQRNQPLSRLIRLTGHVVGVNAEHQFIVIDRGTADGVGVGDHFEVSRNQRPLGVLTVIRLRESITACDAKMLPPSVRVRVGDDVRWLPPSSY